MSQVHRSAIKSLGNEQTRLADGLEASRTALEDTDARVVDVRRQLKHVGKSMVRGINRSQ